MRSKHSVIFGINIITSLYTECIAFYLPMPLLIDPFYTLAVIHLDMAGAISIESFRNGSNLNRLFYALI